MRRALLSVSLVAAIAPGVRAQQATSLIAGDSVSSVELSRIIEATRARGLPVEPILTKIRFAVLVAHAPGPRVIAVVRAMSARLDEARTALAPNPTPGDIAAGEDALSANVSSQALKDIRKFSGNRPVAVSLGVLTQLVASKVEEKQATKIVTDLLRRNATADQLVAFGYDVISDIRSGTKPNSAAEIRTNRLSAVLGVPSATTTSASDLTQAAGPLPGQPGVKKKP